MPYSRLSQKSADLLFWDTTIQACSFRGYMMASHPIPCTPARSFPVLKINITPSRLPLLPIVSHISLKINTSHFHFFPLLPTSSKWQKLRKFISFPFLLTSAEKCCSFSLHSILSHSIPVVSLRKVLVWLCVLIFMLMFHYSSKEIMRSSGTYMVIICLLSNCPLNTRVKGSKPFKVRVLLLI